MFHYDFVMRLLQIFAEDDAHSDLWWNFDKEASITFFVKCSDFFSWASSDCEEITRDNIDILEQSFAAVHAIGKDGWSGYLFCARVRKMRPQGEFYKYIPNELWPLFDECGAPREVGLGNPVAH